MRSTTQNARDPKKPNEIRDGERESVVTPLFAHNTPKRTPVVRFGSPSTFKRVLATTGLLALVVAGGWVLHQNRTQQRATERLALGCLDVSDCRSVVHNIESLQDACMFNCSHLAPLAEQARAQFRSVLEHAAELEQANQDKAYQSAIQARKMAEDELSKVSHTARLAEREHEHRLELERITAQTERLRVAQNTALGAQLAYFKQLSPEQRLKRLEACHKRGTSCEELVQQLSQAAPSLSEQRALIAAHEGYVTADPAEMAESKTAQAISQANSEPTIAERL